MKPQDALGNTVEEQSEGARKVRLPVHVRSSQIAAADGTCGRAECECFRSRWFQTHEAGTELDHLLGTADDTRHAERAPCDCAACAAAKLKQANH